MSFLRTVSSFLKPVSVANDIQQISDFPIHPDIADLLWFSDGPYKNDLNITRIRSQEYIELGSIRIALSMLNAEEPSLISTKLPIMKMDSIEQVERPPYFPTYQGLTPEQRNVYWRLLKNPYDATFDIGFVFLLYYCLERHLLNGNYEKAFGVILKLRDVHTNKSFQSYSANALILTCISKQRPDLAYLFMDSLEKEYEFKFSDNLYLVCKYALKMPLTPKDIMRMSKSFEFTNQNYIKKYAEDFERVLLDNIQQAYSKDSIQVEQFITVVEGRKLKQQTVSMFANLSLIEKQLDIPLFVENVKLKRAMYNLLEKTHEDVKVLIAQKRKEGTLATPSQLEKKEPQVFDI